MYYAVISLMPMFAESCFEVVQVSLTVIKRGVLNGSRSTGQARAIDRQFSRYLSPLVSFGGVKKANYRRIANTYDIARSMSEENLELWLRLISEKLGDHRNLKLLDLGCGTGRFSIPIADRLGYSVTGADESSAMLREARKKDEGAQVKWDIQEATSLSYPVESFDAVFMSHLLHHVDEPLRVVEECHRILRPKGILLDRYGAIEDIHDDPEHRFFPRIIELDRARTPTVEQVEKWFGTAGFKRVSSETIEQRTFSYVEERVKKAELRHTSALTLISQSDFKQGLEALREYVSDNPDDPWLLNDRITLTIGER